MACPSYEPDLAAAATNTAIAHHFKIGNDRARGGQGYSSLNDYTSLSVAVRTARAWAPHPEYERMDGEYMTLNRMLLCDVFALNSGGVYGPAPYACGVVHGGEGTVCTLVDGSVRWISRQTMFATAQANGWATISNHFTSYGPWRADLGNADLLK
jgi:hypothetical protein